MADPTHRQLGGRYLQIDGRPALLFVRQPRHPVDTIWQAIVDPLLTADVHPAAWTGPLAGSATGRRGTRDASRRRSG
jgi:hypothetical protein